MKKKIIIIIAIILVVIVAVVFFVAKAGKSEIHFNTLVVQNETVQVVVTATGYVQPVDKVDIGTQVSGVIEKIYVDFNSVVKKGQLIAELDKSTLAEKVTQAQASLTSAESDLTFSQLNYDRVKQMYDAKAATPASFEDAVNKLAQAKTNIANAKANLHQAQVNLSYAEIYSPIDGVVLNRAVDQGQTVAASFSTPTLFTIANDLTKMQVEADVDEADIGQVKVGQKVTFTVDSYPDDIFEGTVEQVRLQPTVTSNVVTYTVIIEAPNPEEKLFPGMTANVTIVTKTDEGPAIQTEAINFQPTPDMLEKPPIPSEAPPVMGKATEAHSKGVWLKTPHGLEHRNITIGLSDGVNIIVKEGLQAGDTVVLSASKEKKSNNGKAASNPLMPKRPGR